MNHSVIEHRANYHFIKLEEDYLQICGGGGEYPHCKAFILSVLEHWMNDKLAKGQDGYVYMSYPQWIEAMYGLFHRNHIIKCLAELVADSLILKRPYTYQGRDSFAYCLNVSEVQRRLSDLEERTERYTRPNIHPFKFKRIQIQTDTHPNLNGETPSPIQIQTGDPSKFKRNIDYNTENLLHIDTNLEDAGSATASPTPPVFPEQTSSSSVRVVESLVLPPSQATPTPVVVEAPDVRLTTSEQPPTVLVQQRGITQEKRSPRAKKEETPETVRCREIQAKIDALRGFALKKPGLIIDERKVIRDHLAPDGFTDERITAIHGWIVTNIWKYKSVGGRGDVGARVIWEEAERAEAAMRQPDQRASPPAGRVIPMKIVSDFDDPNFRLEDEFYKPERERGYTTHAQADSTLTPGQAVAYAGATPTVRAAW